MSIKFTVEKVSTDALTVRYEDGSYAVVTIDSSMSKDDIELKIAAFSNQRPRFNNVADIPFKEGDSGEALSDREYREKQAKIEQEAQKQRELVPTLSYRELSLMSYPDIGDQMDALYWARQGNFKPLQDIDSSIEEIKSKFPKEMAPINIVEAREKYNIDRLASADRLINFLES